ncbi:MAG: STAS domain-containing protein [Candidatus Promineifilaceae bacterium]
MIIRTRHYNDIAILATNGRIDSVTAPQLLQRIEKQVAIDFTRIVIDLKKVDFLNSIGVKSLLQVAELIRQQGGDIRLVNVHMRLKSILNLVGVEDMFKIYPNVVLATVSYFPSPSPARQDTMPISRKQSTGFCG